MMMTIREDFQRDEPLINLFASIKFSIFLNESRDKGYCPLEEFGINFDQLDIKLIDEKDNQIEFIEIQHPTNYIFSLILNFVETNDDYNYIDSEIRGRYITIIIRVCNKVDIGSNRCLEPICPKPQPEVDINFFRSLNNCSLVKKANNIS